MKTLSNQFISSYISGDSGEMSRGQKSQTVVFHDNSFPGLMNDYIEVVHLFFCFSHMKDMNLRLCLVEVSYFKSMWTEDQ